MESRVNYTIVGVFVSIFTLALVGFVFWLGKYGYKEEVFDYYKIYIRDSVSGLHKESSVKFRGVNVGVVNNIKINPQNSEEIEVLIKIAKDTPIKEDNIAIVKSQGITGLSYIELKGGSQNSPLLKRDGETPNIKSEKSLFTKLETSATNITEKIDLILNKLDLVLSQKNIENFEKFVSNLETISSDFKAKDENITKILSKAILVEESMIKTFENISNTSSDFKLKWATLMNTFTTTVNRGDYNFKEMSKESIIKLNELLSELKLVAYEAEDLIKELKRNPANLIFKNSDIKLGPGERR